MRKILPTLYERILDEDGRVRWATVQTLDSFRSLNPDELYVEIYLKLKEMHEQHTGGKRRSIGQALDKLYCPHLKMLLKAREYAFMGLYTNELRERLELEAWINGAMRFAEDMRKKNVKEKLKMKSTPINPDAALEEILSQYIKRALVGMAKIIQLPSPRTGLGKRELVEMICTHLRDLRFLERIVDGLREEERLALVDLMLKNCLMPWDEFAEEYGDDLKESFYWNWRPPETLMGRLKARGLIAVRSFNGRDWILIPRELRSLLWLIQKGGRG